MSVATEFERAAQRGASVLDSAARDNAKPAPEPLCAVDLAALLRHPFPEREYILAPVLTLGSLSMVYAWRGIGKTHFALGLAYAAASGGEFLGWKAARPFRVLYIDGEMPGEALQARLASIVASSDAEPPDGFFRVLTIDLQDGRMPDLSTMAGQAAVQAECDRADLIVADNLSSLFRTGRENEGESWQPAAEWALRQRSAGKAVVFVHHSGKDGNQRGTSKKEDLLDLVLSLRRPADYDANQGARFVVNFEKARHLQGDAVQSIEARMEQDKHGRLIWTTKPTADSVFEQVINLASLGLNQREIAEELHVNKSTVHRHWKKAEETGAIRPKPRTGGKGVVIEFPRHGRDDE